ncbi:MAG: hypothetical protein LBR33_11555 [Propionibacteriaceae bacterium]|jgi:putative ABC transport system permease protein|nr:hypothetical protein [Propionibacteriaceae bacterium]
MRAAAVLACAALRRHPASAAVLGAFTALAAFLVTLGLIVATDYGSAFDQLFDAAHGPHLAVLEAGRDSAQDAADLLAADGVEEVEEEAVLATAANLDFAGQDVMAWVMVSDLDAARTMDVAALVEGAWPGDGEVALPYVLATSGGYALGAVFSVELPGTTLTATVSGFTAEPVFGGAAYQWYRLYVSSSAYADLAEAAPAAAATLISARVTDVADVDRIQLDFVRDHFAADAALVGDSTVTVAEVYPYATARLGRTFFASILAAILLVFAALVAAVSLVVVRFRVRTTIEESVQDIGAEKAVGFTSGQIALALLLQFGLVALAGALVGVGLAYLALPGVARLLEAQSALQWRPGFYPGVTAGVVLGLLAAVVATTGLAALRLRRLSALTALRSGLPSAGVTANRLPLVTTAGSRTLLLALKQSLQARGQLAMTGLIAALGTVAATALLSMYASFGLTPEKLSDALVGEVPDVTVSSAADAGAVAEELAARPDVDSVFLLDLNVRLLVDGALAYGEVVSDSSELRGGLLLSGAYPAGPGEVALGVYFADLFDVHAGDTVTLSAGGVSGEFVVSGEIQTVQNAGQVVLVTVAGLQSLVPEYTPSRVCAYLADPAESGALVTELAADPRVGEAVDFRALVAAEQGVYTGLIGAVAGVITLVTAGVVGLVLYLVLATAIRRRRQAHGIQKAVGFTTRQLIGQIALAYLPAVLVGIGLGAVVGGLATGPAMTVIFRGLGLGLATVDVTANVGLTVALAIGLGLCALATTLAVAARLRKVSAKELVVE